MKDLTETFPMSLASLKNLQHEAQRTQLLTKSLLHGRKSQPTYPNSHILPPLPPLTLPIPEDIDSIFKDFTSNSHLVTELTSKYRNAIQQLQHIHHQKFEQACHDLCQLPRTNNSFPLHDLLNGTRRLYESSYNDRFLPMMKNEILALRSKYAPFLGLKTPFNAESTPLLERYFEYNAYPSAPDRKALASKTKMIPRQIEVWFQNHRKRARDHGKVIRKMAPNLSQNVLLSLDASFSSCVPPYAKPDSSVSSDEEEHCAAEVSTDILSGYTAPSCAFPSPFSPSNSRYHFHTDATFSFPPPVWVRAPSSAPVPHSNIKFDDFVSSFAAKLNLREATKADKRQTLRRAGHRKPWFSATTTVASCAPHAAFIRTPKHHPAQSRVARFGAKYAISTSIISQPLSDSTSSFSKYIRTSPTTKPAPFEKRQPTYQPFTHILSSDPTRSPAGISTPSPSRLSSSSSFSSVESSAPSSPNLDPHSDNQFSIVNEDLQFLDDIFNDTSYSNSDHVYSGHPQFSINYDLLSKQPQDTSCPLGYLDGPIPIMTNNYVQAMS